MKLMWAVIKELFEFVRHPIRIGRIWRDAARRGYFDGYERGYEWGRNRRKRRST
jgi:hypothetical protein